MRRLKKSAPLIGLALLAFIALGVVGFALMRQTGPNAQEISQFNEELKRKDAADAQSALDSTQTRISFPSGRPLNVLFVGDSITYGLYASTPDQRWSALVTAGLSQQGKVTTSYSAAPGRTTVDALANPTPVGQDLTFVLLGNNDIAKLDIATFTSKYEELLGRLHSESPNGKLVCVSPYAAPSFGPEFVAAEQKACEAAGARYIDIRPINAMAENRSVVGTPWFEGVAKDTAHPSDAGHKAIAEAILKTISTGTPTSQPTREFVPAVGFLGDSYTAGDGASSRAVRWTTLLSAKRGWVETNAGFGGTGYGTAGRLAGGQPYDARVAQATNTVADAAHPIIIVSGGRNDLSEKTAAADISAGITDTFTDLRKVAPKAKIIALSPLWDDDKAPSGLATIGQQVRAAVESVGGQYVDLGQPLAGRADLIGPDGVHPNDAGYAFLADQIDAALPKDLP